MRTSTNGTLVSIVASTTLTLPPLVDSMTAVPPSRSVTCGTSRARIPVERAAAGGAQRAKSSGRAGGAASLGRRWERRCRSVRTRPHSLTVLPSHCPSMSGVMRGVQVSIGTSLGAWSASILAGGF